MKYRLIVRASPSAEVKLQIAQQNKNLSGEILLQTLHQAIMKENINLSTFSGDIERFDPATTFPTPAEMPISVAIGIITRDIPLIFKLSSTPKGIGRFSAIHTDFVRQSSALQQLWSVKSNKTLRASFEKVYPKYNKCLNFFQQHLRSDACEPDIAEKRMVIRCMAFYAGPYSFHAKTDPVPTPVLEVTLGQETRFTNYDGMQILDSQPLRVRVSPTQNPMTQQYDGGVAFGFDTQEEAYNMWCAAVDNATPDNLKKKEIYVTRPFARAGNLATIGGVYYIELRFRHNQVDAILPSYSNKIIACLTNSNVKPIVLSNMLDNEAALKCPAKLYVLGRYREYHMRVQKKIKQLMNDSFSRPDFPLVCIDCYRPGCNHFNVFQKAGRATEVICAKCRIAEFCLKCTRASHGGECDRLDEASEQLIRENTRACPRCNTNVEKNGGCNHMSCRCGAHFCWLCNQHYERNQINDHYLGMDPYGRCRGLLNPVPAHGGGGPGGVAIQPEPAADGAGLEGRQMLHDGIPDNFINNDIPIRLNAGGLVRQLWHDDDDIPDNVINHNIHNNDIPLRLDAGGGGEEPILIVRINDIGVRPNLDLDMIANALAAMDRHNGGNPPAPGPIGRLPNHEQAEELLAFLLDIPNGLNPPIDERERQSIIAILLDIIR